MASFRPALSRPLLGGRLTIGMDPSAHVETPPTFGVFDEGSAVPSSEFAVSLRGDAFVVRATETFWQAAPELAPTLEAEARARLGDVHALGALAAFPGSLVFVKHDETESHGGPSPLASAYLPMPEGTLVRVEVSVWAHDSAIAPSACVGTIADLLATVTLGPTRLDLAGGAHPISPYLRLDVPAGYAVEAHSFGGESWEVRLTRPMPWGSPPYVLLVEVTQHPPNIAYPVDRAGPYLGRHVSWRHLYMDGMEGRSAILRIPGREEYAFSRIMVPTAEDVAPLVALAGRIRVVRP